MKSIFYHSLIILGFWNIIQIVRADHCDAKYDVTLAPPKIDDKNYKPPVDEERDSCSLSYLSILNPDESPTADDGCVIRGFHLKDGTVGPSCIPEIGKLPRDSFFSINMFPHRIEAGELFDVFFKCSTFEDFKNAALYYKSKVNPMLFSFVFSTAIMNRPDTNNFPLPNLHQTKPDMFFNNKIIDKAKQKLNKNMKRSIKSHEKAKYLASENIHPKGRKPRRPGKTLSSKPIPPRKEPEYKDEAEPEFVADSEPEEAVGMGSVPNDIQLSMTMASPPMPNFQRKLPFIAAPKEKQIIEEDQPVTINKNNPEYKMTYFREDITLNSHHNQFHVIYPTFWRKWQGLKDRKGEFFYYMHNQMIKRYNGDRMAVGLKSVKPLNITEADTKIEDGYYPNLNVESTGKGYSGRARNLKLRSINVYGTIVKISSMLQYIENVVNAINDGYVEDNYGNKLPLDEENGIDLLGSAVESSDYSPNVALYGDIHNMGHMLLSYIHDNNGLFKAPPSVMSHTATALRDPVFWRWHKMVDDLLNLHKAKLPPYTDDYLTWNDINIKHIDVQSYPHTGEESEETYPPSKCYTYFKNRKIDISRGLDFNAHDKVVRVNINHMDHLPFNYVINVNSLSEEPVDGHVRIFFSPKKNENGKLATNEELRRNAIEMDRFTVELKHGQNIITRGSNESAVTMTPGREWASISEADVEFSGDDNEYDKRNDRMKPGCGCGWPHHLLIPRGTLKGIKYVLFVMISNWSNEKVDDSEIYRSCDSSLTMCGLLFQKFPDQRPMGFPLDRPILKQQNWFKRPNMIMKDITIYHI